MAGIGVPIKLLHEAEGHIVTLEMNSGEVYRGTLTDAEDNMNCSMKDVTVTHRDGHVTSLEQCFIRGSKVRFVVVPDMLKNAPMFKRIGSKAPRGLGRGAPLGRGRGMGIKK